jgi:hypothetical protein
MATRATPKTVLVTLFDRVLVPAGGNAVGPASAIDLTGYAGYRLVLRLDGTAGTPFQVNELYGPAGPVQQLNVDIDSGTVDDLGSLNYRRSFEVFGPRGIFLRIFNNGADPLQVSGSLYAIQL